MTFQITALPYDPFAAFFTMPEDELTRRLARRVIATDKPGFPCRVSLADAEPGEELILVNHQHLPAASPYRAAHAVFVRRAARQAFPAAGEIPDFFTFRVLSLRAFDGQAMLLAAALVQGAGLKDALPMLLRDAAVAHVDIHFAKPGCYAARARRALP